LRKAIREGIQWKLLLGCIALPLAAGGLSALLTRNGMEGFGQLNQPPLSPPAWLFPVVWSILYILMGIAAYLVLTGGGSRRETRRAMLRAGQASVAELFVAQMQDYLALGGDSRTNVPGVAEGNWVWRMAPGAASDALAAEIRSLTETYGRT